jgi:hypothetical protein
MLDKNAFLTRLSEGRGSAFGKQAFASQDDTQKVFSAIWALESEVNNGGFHQYFINCSGSPINFAPHALRRIRANSCAGIVESALGVVSSGSLPEDDDARQALLESLDDEAMSRLESLDAEFYSYPDDLTELLFEFVRAHPDEFGPTPV